jgi:hypothetical protein
VRGNDLPRTGEQQRNRMGRNFIDAIRRDMPDNDPSLGRGVHIDVVRPDAVTDDYFAAPKPLHQFASDFQSAAEDPIRRFAQPQRFLKGKFFSINEFPASPLDDLALALSRRVTMFNQNNFEFRHRQVIKTKISSRKRKPHHLN